MAVPVTMGAQILCNQGVAPTPLVVTDPTRPLVENMPAAVITDMVPMTNIVPFGMCRSIANPTVAAATSAALGVLTPMPCVPVTVAPWTPGSATVTIGGKPALTASSQCTCAWGGQISVLVPNAVTTTIGS
ncbi:MAG: DUF4280 domain-containing protein [Acidimicrobiales bacterium]